MAKGREANEHHGTRDTSPPDRSGTPDMPGTGAR